MRVSCLMVTLASENRHEMLQKSISSYIDQTHIDKELLIVVDSLDLHDKDRLLSYISTLQRSDIRCIFPEQKMTLGMLRNLSMREASGDILCQWDDDDLFHPVRVEEQLNFLLKNDLDGVLLTDNLHIFAKRKLCYWEKWTNKTRGHPATIMVKKNHDIQYPEYGPQSEREEDLNFLKQFRERHKLDYFEAPPFYYLYFFHEKNTWNIAHHEILAKRMSVSGETLSSNLERIISGITEIRAFTFPNLTFIEKDGSAFSWVRK